MWRTAISSAFLVALLACTGPANSSPVENVKEHFVDSIARDWASFEVCEHRSPRDDRKAFYSKALELAPNSLQRVVAWREVTVRAAGESHSVHVGVAELEFATAALAQTFAQPGKDGPRYLAASKILTRYVVLQKERTALIIYSESHARPAVGKFLDAAAASGAKFWESTNKSD